MKMKKKIPQLLPLRTKVKFRLGIEDKTGLILGYRSHDLIYYALIDIDDYDGGHNGNGVLHCDHLGNHISLEMTNSHSRLWIKYEELTIIKKIPITLKLPKSNVSS